MPIPVDQKPSPHDIFLLHVNTLLQASDVWLDPLQGVWSREIPEVLPADRKKYPCYVVNLMTPLDDLEVLNDGPEIEPLTTLRYINEVHALSQREASLLNEYILATLNESDGIYENGQIEACVKIGLTPDHVDNRRGGQPVFRVGYSWNVLVSRVILL